MKTCSVSVAKDSNAFKCECRGNPSHCDTQLAIHQLPKEPSGTKPEQLPCLHVCMFLLQTPHHVSMHAHKKKKRLTPFACFMQHVQTSLFGSVRKEA